MNAALPLLLPLSLPLSLPLPLPVPLPVPLPLPLPLPLTPNPTTANVDDGLCTPLYPGCTNSRANNYRAVYNMDDGSCHIGGCQAIYK